MAPSVSIVVPTYQRRDSLMRLLDALAAQTHPLDDLEVIVVDDGSTDGTREALIAARTPYRLRGLSQPNSGAGAARNLAVSQSRGRIVIFFDDDVLPDEGAVAAHVAAHRRAPDTVVVGPMLPATTWRRPAWIEWEETKLVEQYRAMLAGLYECTPRQFFTANASIERQRFLDAEGFDPRFARAEDVEFGYRLRDLGASFIFEPAARVTHYPQRTFASWRRTPYQYGRGDVVMWRDKGHQALELAYLEFHRRHALNRSLARACVGRPVPFAAATIVLRGVVRAADALRMRVVAQSALSALFNLLYWQGVNDELGGPAELWRSVAAFGGAMA